MQNLNDLKNLVNELQLTTSTNEKQEILKKYPQCKSLLKYTYDPLIQYYVTSKNLIKNINLVSGNTSESFTLTELLDNLVERKFTGHEAISRINSFIREAGCLDSTYEKLIYSIIDRDLRIGMSVKLINKVFPKLISYTPYMRCGVANEKTISKINFPAYSELKSDGTFCNFIVNGDKVDYIARSGLGFNFFNLFDMGLIKLKDNVNFDLKNKYKGFTFTGELLILEDGKIMPREYGNGIIGKFQKDNETGSMDEALKIRIRIWDFVPIENFFETEEFTLPRWNRYDILKKYLHDANFFDSSKINKILLTPCRVVGSFKEALQHWEEVVQQGEEGTIIKDVKGTWKDGTSPYQLKLKVEVDFDLKVIGFNEGEGKFRGSLGSVICESTDGKIKVNVSGWKEKTGSKEMQRQYIWDNKDLFLNKILCVRSNNLTQDKNTGDMSIYLPRAVEWRRDKLEADSLERIEEIYKMDFMLLKQ